ncbi:baseplate J/gp47 family protein [Mesorhizobium sp. 2RAF21]|uniref:baseplate J/gp47 family protein n=1 Tax=Mesorhizobium sp. 2RAF21 TaxID=3232995 RepID=UPI003F9C2E96
MAWLIPKAGAIAERIAGSLESLILAIRPDVDPIALSRAVRSPRGMFAILGRAVAMEVREIHDHIAWWSRQYFPDTAEDEMADRHASIWGVEKRPATFAVGSVTVEGVAGTPLPSDLEFAASDGVAVKSTAAAVIGVGGTVSIPVIALVSGQAGNIAAGIRLRAATPFPAISRVTVDAAGLAGGAPEETPRELSAATIAHIRQPPHGGAGFDYPEWLRAAFDVRAVAVVTDWIGRGSVGVIVAMKDGLFGRPPTVPEQGAMLAYLGPPGSVTGLRPVTANVVVVPVVIEAVPISIRLRPDTPATRAAITAAYMRFVATIGNEEDAQNAGPIGARIEPSRISEALSAAAGEYAHDLVVPAAAFTLDRDHYPVPGAITFLAAP